MENKSMYNKSKNLLDDFYLYKLSVICSKWAKAYPANSVVFEVIKKINSGWLEQMALTYAKSLYNKSYFLCWI